MLPHLTSRLVVIGIAGLLAATVGIADASAPAHADTGAILGAGSPDAIPNSYLVVLHDHAIAGAGVAARAADLTDRFGGRIGHIYQAALNGFSVSMSEPAARRLAAHPAVAYVEQDRVVSLSATQLDPPSWGLDRIDQRNLPLNDRYTYLNTASGVRVYVLDTGIRISHSDFGGRASHGRDTVDNDNNASDCHGHGTHVAGTVGGAAHGVAKQVQLVAVRVLDCAGNGTTASVVAGVDWVTANAIKPAVANMSLGGPANPIIDNAVAASIATGITYVIAAGNNNGGDACGVSPARVPAAITVGATRITDARASFSNIGSCLDLFAPGEDITSAWRTSNTATSVQSGTSMAAPHVAGAAALVLASHPGWSPQGVRDLLVSNATTGKVTDRGSGSPDRLLAAAPPVITALFCDYHGRKRFSCSLVTSGWTQIQWTVNGTELPAGNQLSVTGICSGSSASVRAAVSNPFGTASRFASVSCV